MARWATTCVIAGVSFSGCRVEIVDAGGFLSQNIGSVDWANDGSTVIQVVNRSHKGQLFGLRMVSAEMTKLQSVFTAIQTAEGSNSGVELEHVEGVFNLDLIVTPDYSQKEWFTYDHQSEGYYEGVSLRFISKGDA